MSEYTFEDIRESDRIRTFPKNDDFYEQSNQQHGQHRFSSNGDAHPGHLVRARVVGSQRGEDHEESEGGRAVTATWAATIEVK